MVTVAAKFESSEPDLKSGDVQKTLDINSLTISIYFFLIQEPSFVFTEEYQQEFLQEYHKAFDNLRTEFLVGEMPWNFADFMTLQGKLLVRVCHRLHAIVCTYVPMSLLLASVQALFIATLLGTLYIITEQPFQY